MSRHVSGRSAVSTPREVHQLSVDWPGRIIGSEGSSMIIGEGPRIVLLASDYLKLVNGFPTRIKNACVIIPATVLPNISTVV
jgi:hypothetical protein